MNPLDEYMQLRKEAGFFDGWKGTATDAGRTALMGGAIAAGGALVGLGASAINKIRESISRKRDFQQMMAVDPELKHIQAERPQFFNQAFNSLRSINPTFGSDPIIAGSYLRKMMANPDAAGLTLATTVKPLSLDEKGESWSVSHGDKGFDIGVKY